MAFMSYLFKPMTVLTPQGDKYLKRYYLLRTRWFEVYIHHIFRSDPDADLHDHPWWFVSCILWGGYIEHTQEGKFKRRAPQILYRPEGSPHRLELAKPAWTFVLTGPVRRTWGFVTARGWEPHTEHTMNPASDAMDSSAPRT
ncbi:MAG: hypothetical protein NTW19_14020 [Planctomycetota bacterium]|nr:hypothetical protein [Planctomycetota bacterium]